MKRMYYPPTTIYYNVDGVEHFKKLDWDRLDRNFKDFPGISFKDMCKMLNKTGKRELADSMVRELRDYINDDLYGQEWGEIMSDYDKEVEDEFHYLCITKPLFNTGVIQRWIKDIQECINEIETA